MIEIGYKVRLKWPMCFSAEVEKDLKKLAKFFQAQKSEAAYFYFESLKLRESEHEWLKHQLNLKHKPRSQFFKEPNQDGRIYPNTFAPVMVWEQGARVIKPMRYRLRPFGSKEEIPTKFNVFNARFDSLESRQTWRPLFMRQHGLFPFKRFFEWVEHEGKPRLISFVPKERELMWAPCLWDQWISKDGSLAFHSFALITDDPPAEVTERGHDRCPIFLKEEFIDGWLNPGKKSKQEMRELLKQKESAYFEGVWAQ